MRQKTVVRRRGPTIGATSSLVVKMPDEMRAAIEARSKIEGVKLSEATRRLIAIGLRTKPKPAKK